LKITSTLTKTLACVRESWHMPLNNEHKQHVKYLQYLLILLTPPSSKFVNNRTHDVVCVC